MKMALIVSFLSLLAGAPAGAASAPVHEAAFGLETGRPVVMMTVDGEGPFPFVFDTGAPGLIVMKSLADKLGLEIVGREAVSSPAGGTPVEADRAAVGSIELAGARAENLVATVLDFGGPEAGLGAGVVGPAVFRDYGRVALDFRADRVAIGGAFEAPADASWIAFGPSAPLLDAPLRIGEATIPAHIDTGAPHVISVPGKYADALPLSGPIQTVGRARTIDGEFEIKSAPIDATARIGDAEIPLSQIHFFDIPVANVGTGALRGLLLEIDWEGERFALSGRAEPVQPQARRARVPAPSGDGKPDGGAD